MPNLTIPERYASGLERILKLSPEDSEQIALALEKAKTTGVRELVDRVVTAVPNLSIRHARELVETLRSLYAVRMSMELTVDSFVHEIIKVARQESTNINFETPKDEEIASSTLHALLSIRPLSMLSKARALHTDHENIFCSARIMSDLRPVFDADASKDPAGFVIAHTLKLGYHHNGKHTELYVAMDKADLEMMIEVLQRAQAKAVTLNHLGHSKEFKILAE